MSDSMSRDAGFTSLVASVMSRAREEEEALKSIHSAFFECSDKDTQHVRHHQPQ